MFGLLKFVWLLGRSFVNLLNVDRNALAYVPNPTKYLAMILLSCFWCLAFGLYIGELLTIGYNMLGHVAIVTMVFVTWYTFRNLNTDNPRGANYLRMPDYSSRCDEYTDEQRAELAKRI
jgi:fatty acid desaturase